MKSIKVLMSALLLISTAYVFGNDNDAAAPGAAGATKIRIVFNDQEAVVAMFDNPASRDFLSLLPLTAEFSDFAGAEKIASLPRRLETRNSPVPHDATGDFTYYAPWGNLAVFYKGFGRDSNLYVLGRIESGKEKLARMRTSFTARIERLD